LYLRQLLEREAVSSTGIKLFVVVLSCTRMEEQGCTNLGLHVAQATTFLQCCLIFLQYLCGTCFVSHI